MLEAKARALGFDAVRIVSPHAIPEAPARLAQWLTSGAHGDMDWMAETAERRADPRVLWSEVKSIVMLAMNYAQDDVRALIGVRANLPRETHELSREISPAPRELSRETSGEVSIYARNRDYHDVIKGKLKLLAAWMVRQAGDGAVKVFVDTAPVMEKPLAAAAGLGWQGKHTNLVSREFGSWLFLGSIFTTLELTPDAPETDHCGSCRACLDSCPTNAFPAPYQLDARRCISYLTIEHKGPIAREFRAPMGNRIYGCDDCLAVCPWNKYAQAAHEAKFAAREELNAPPLAMLARLDDAGFRKLFSGSPIKRVGHTRFMRNVMIAIGNSGDASLREIVCEKLSDPAPLVRGMAVWAAGRLFAPVEFDALRARYAPREEDADVRGEWETTP